LRPRGRRERSFTVFFSAFAVLLLFEAATYAAQGPGLFKGRYVFVLLSFVPIAFGVYLKRGRPLGLVVVGLAALTAIAAVRLPISTYTNATFRSDSSFLLGVGFVQDKIGVVPTSFLLAGAVTLGVVGAIAVALRGGGGFALVAAICFAALASAATVAADISRSDQVRATLPDHLTWVDDAVHGHVTAIATPSSPPVELIDQLYWNQSIQREVLLDDAAPTDAFSAPKLRIGRDGSLENIRGDLLVHNFGTTVVPANARLIAREQKFSLWRAGNTPRLRLLIENRFFDQWLAPGGRIRVWPRPGRRATQLAFRLSLPQSWQHSVVRVQVGGTSFAVRRGSSVEVVCKSSDGALDARFSSSDAVLQPDFRALAVRLSQLRATDIPPGSPKAGCRRAS
jgi:hypothetical protein